MASYPLVTAKVTNDYTQQLVDPVCACLRTVINYVAEAVGVHFKPRAEFDRISFSINFCKTTTGYLFCGLRQFIWDCGTARHVPLQS